MKRLNFDQDIQPLSEFRSKATSLISQVRNSKRPMVITQHGKSAVVILDVGEYERLMEKIELLEDIRLAEAQIKAGQGIDHATAKERILGKLSGKI